MTLSSESPKQTEALGAALLPLLPERALVALYGNLAAGKTCLVRGMAGAAHAASLVSSPTFVIVNEYGGERPIHHLDLYRLTDQAEIAGLGYEELFDPEDGITLVEWADRAANLLPARRLDIRLEHAGGDSRKITIENLGILANGWQSRLRQETKL